MRRFACLVGTLAVLSCARVFAMGVGVQGTAVLTFHEGDGGVAVTLKLDNIPCMFTVSVLSFHDPVAVGVRADWIKRSTIVGPWQWYRGIGAAAELDLAPGFFKIGAGPRFTIGTDVLLVNDFLELYAQAAWQPMLFVGTDAGCFHPFSIPLDIGVRFWF